MNKDIIGPIGGEISNLIRGLPAQEFAAVVLSFIDFKKHERELQASLLRLRQEYEALGIAQQATMSGRDQDRELARHVMTLYIQMGQYELATEIFKIFLDAGPQFTTEVVRIILERDGQR